MTPDDMADVIVAIGRAHEVDSAVRMVMRRSFAGAKRLVEGGDAVEALVVLMDLEPLIAGRESMLDKCDKVLSNAIEELTS